MLNVPCNGCILCCQCDAVRILPHDRRGYLIEPHPLLPGENMIAHKDNGDCIYLRSNGCSIQHRKPIMCREMDCRAIAKTVSRAFVTRLEQQGHSITKIWNRGRVLLEESLQMKDVS